MLIFITLFILFFSYLDYRALMNGNVNWGFDLAYYINSIYNTSIGRFLITSIPGEDTFVSKTDHGSGIIIAFISLFTYFFKMHFFFFSLFKITWLAIGAIAIYLIAKNRFDDERYGLLFGVGYLFYPMFQITCLSDFRPLNLIITPFLFSFYFYEKKEYFFATIFSLIALSVREEGIYLIIAMYIYFLIKTLNEKNIDQSIKLSLSILLQLIALFSILYPLIKFDLFTTLLHYGRIQFTPEKITYLNFLSFLILLSIFCLPSLFIGLFSFMNLLNLPLYIEYFLVGVPAPFTLYTYVLHYYSSAIPFTYLSIIYSFYKIKKRVKAKNRILIFLIILAVGFFLTLLLVRHTNIRQVYDLNRYLKTDIEEDYYEILKFIDTDSPMAVDGDIAYLFSLRPYIYTTPSFWEVKYNVTTLYKSKYIILPKNETFVEEYNPENKAEYKEILEKLDKNFKKLYEGKIFLLFENENF